MINNVRSLLFALLPLAGCQQATSEFLPQYPVIDLLIEDGVVIDGLTDEIKKSLSNRGAGSFAIPGLVKIEKKKVPARPARKGVPNPFKPGELMDVPAKRASVKVKVRALKALRDMA